MPARYEFVVEGEVDLAWFAWFDGLAPLPCPPGRTRLLAILPDQSALQAVLARVFDLNLPLVSVLRMEG